MNRIDKLTCLKETMQGRIDINSKLCLNSITPICKCDYLNKSVENNDSINLLDVDPFILEDLVSILFRNMGPNCVQGPCPEGNMTCGKIVEIREKFKNL